MKMVNKQPLDGAELDPFFDAARDTIAQPSDDLMARIMADASALAAPSVARAEPGPGPLARLLGLIGGWPAAAGLATAALTGVMIGLASPDALQNLTDGFLTTATQYQIEDLMPSFGDLLGEG